MTNLHWLNQLQRRHGVIFGKTAAGKLHQDGSIADKTTRAAILVYRAMLLMALDGVEIDMTPVIREGLAKSLGLVMFEYQDARGITISRPTHPLGDDEMWRRLTETCPEDDGLVLARDRAEAFAKPSKHGPLMGPLAKDETLRHPDTFIDRQIPVRDGRASSSLLDELSRRDYNQEASVPDDAAHLHRRH